ncbi:multidrug effflux MFS transporter [Stakelama tenebrarum]|uniref:Multidrug effflux MFS transporter n=1 Tax=Stakelama tenebrarum TaxID=2711215 RepID=A0A6G6Y106_9SPHN|nr:multidrug effflux MFS transporter [Sphingosinithalassobacter tenebrarum]QIG78398.1 multidrug effflux MFS transporter [Sphingosinithalassobacter tenebrarum]
MDQPATPVTAAPRDGAPLRFGEFVAIVAMMMGLSALGIDAMLPALPAIGDSLNIPGDNERQFIITAFLIGYGLAHLIYGPLSDRFGRKPVLAIGLLAYVLGSIACAVSGSFTAILLARAASGASVAAARVVIVAVVRDCYSGRAMAKVMSLAFMLFMATPILAPAFGQAVLALTGNWRFIFYGIGLLTLLALVWFLLRMPETHHAEARSSLDLRGLIARYRRVTRDRYLIGYTIASTAMAAGLFGFIASIQQIVFDIFERPDLLIVVFGAVAGTMSVSSFVNSRIVMHFGTRRISHTALLAMTGIAAGHLVLAAFGQETLWSFTLLQAVLMACFGLANANFSAMAMENMGPIAGTASSFQGFVMTLGGAIGGAVTGQFFDGTTVPLFIGFVLFGLVALAAILITEKGRLFRHN